MICSVSWCFLVMSLVFFWGSRPSFLLRLCLCFIFMSFGCMVSCCVFECVCVCFILGFCFGICLSFLCLCCRFFVGLCACFVVVLRLFNRFDFDKKKYISFKEKDQLASNSRRAIFTYVLGTYRAPSSFNRPVK